MCHIMFGVILSLSKPVPYEMPHKGLVTHIASHKDIHLTFSWPPVLHKIWRSRASFLGLPNWHTTNYLGRQGSLAMALSLSRGKPTQNSYPHIPIVVRVLQGCTACWSGHQMWWPGIGHQRHLCPLPWSCYGENDSGPMASHCHYKSLLRNPHGGSGIICHLAEKESIRLFLRMWGNQAHLFRTGLLVPIRGGP